MHLLQYKTEKYKTLIFNISDKAPLNAILKYINLVESGMTSETQEQVFFSLMELLNNSLRAQRESDSNDVPIRVTFDAREDFLHMEIFDMAGGFDLSILPYDINQDPQTIDNQNPAFQRYREEYQYRRFGMGILTARKTFDQFTIMFHSKGNVSSRFNPDSTEGTIITLGVKWNEPD